MSLRAWPPGRWRAALWAAGACLSLSYYLLGAVQAPRRTPVGVEHRLFGVDHATVSLKEAPSGGRWLVVLESYNTANGAVFGRARSLPAWVDALLLARWPLREETSRTLAPFLPAETSYWLDGDRLRRAWRYPVTRWLDEAHLVSAEKEIRVLDLHTGRTYRGPAAEAVASRFPNAEEPDPELAAMQDAPNEAAERSALEETPPDLGGTAMEHTVAGRVFQLIWNGGGEGPHGIYAAGKELAPRSLRLVANAGQVVKLSRDGRTLFFLRDGALWRLDLRKPVPQLLDEVPVPALPDLPEEQ